MTLELETPLAGDTSVAFPDFGAQSCGDLEVGAGGGQGTGAGDLLYSFAAPVDGTYRFLLNASFDAILWAADTCAEGPAECVAGVNTGAAGEDESLVVALAQGQTITLVVDGVTQADEGGFTLTAMTLGLSCEVPLELAELPGLVLGSTAGASDDLSVTGADCGVSDFAGEVGVGAPDIVHSLSVTYDQEITLRLVPIATDFDAVVYVLSDCGAPTTSCVALANVPGAQGGEVVSFAATAGTTYFVIVDGGAATLEGAYTLGVEGSETGLCVDGDDNDNDGFTDCGDTDCSDDIFCSCAADEDCDDADPCTEDACDLGSGVCSWVVDDCDDLDLCTIDGCIEGVGCDNAAIDNCPMALPYTTAFDCDEGAWSLISLAGDGGWAIDATPADPGPLSMDCALNFNREDSDPPDYGSIESTGTATSLPIDGTNAAALWLSYYDYWDTEDGPTTIYDLRELRVSIDGFATYDVIPAGHSDADRSIWVWRSVDLSAYIGEEVQVQFWFDTTDGTFNDGPGWFVDELTVDETAPVPPTEVCDDGWDNDVDGSVDCADLDCAMSPACSK